ncbi:MAG: LysR family transcriptional regulator [Alphaproteobacteria bacterium]|nr:LysR family transcriptional regulator [Alphaproteobacteria bacterium]
MEMYQIRYFLAVCETLNFTKASEKCFITQPSLTKAIQKLEEVLGGRLFNRTKNSVQLTELGHIMQPHLAELYNSAKQAQEQAKKFLSNQTIKLTVGIMCTLAFEPLIPILTEFQDKHPNIELHFEQGTLEKLVNDLDREEIDLALMASPYEFSKRFTSTFLYKEDFVIACPSKHPLSGQRNLSLKDLDGENYVARKNCEYTNYIDDLLDNLKISLPVKHATEREDWIIQMINAGMGITFMPLNSCLFAGLSYATLADQPLTREVQAITITNKENTLSIKSFLDYITHHNWHQSLSNTNWIKSISA